MIDGVILTALYMVIVVLVAAVSSGNASPAAASLLAALGNVAVIAMILGYYAWFLGTEGQTIGKRILGVKVIDEESGQPIGMGRAALRTVVFFLLAMPCYLGYLTVFLDQSGKFRGWHDLASNSHVIAVEPTPMGEAFIGK